METEEFKARDLAMYGYMKIGLSLLVLGFVLQIVANALHFKRAA